MELTEEQQLIRDTVREFAVKEVEPKAAELDRTGEFPWDTIRKMAELGLMGVPFPEEVGGSGGGTMGYAITVEEISRVCGSTGLILAAHTSLGTYPIYRHGNPEQKAKYLRRLCQGEIIGAFGLTEPNAGSDAGGTQTMAVRDGDHYVINGSKCFITSGGIAEVVVLTAVTEKGAGTGGISAFLIDKGTPGFIVAKKEDKFGVRGSETNVLHFEDCRVPAGALLGKEGEGFKIFMDTLDGGRISIGAMALGIAQGAFDHAVRYAGERVQFGRPIKDFQGIQWMLADMATDIEAARHLVYQAARMKDRGERTTKQSAMAKLFASEAAMRVTNKALQIHGGYGFLKEYPVERFLRDAKLTEIGEGTSEIQRHVIAREILR